MDPMISTAPALHHYATPAALSDDALEAAVTTLVARIAVATRRWLHLLAEFDRREAWAGWGLRSRE